jgi:hypothetical protein
MSTERTPLLLQVNYQVKIPGFTEPFLSPQMRFDPEFKRLLVRTPMGVIPFSPEDEGIRVSVLDLDVPTYLRNQMKDDGWFEMSLTEFINIINLSYLTEG